MTYVEIKSKYNSNRNKRVEKVTGDITTHPLTHRDLFLIIFGRNREGLSIERVEVAFLKLVLNRRRKHDKVLTDRI